MKKVILINIGLLVYLIFSCCLYERRQAIVKSNRVIQYYSVLDRSSSRYSGTLLVEYNSKQYYVGVSKRQALSYSPHKVRLFYDQGRDEIFEESAVSVRGLVALFAIFLGSIAWLCAIIWKRQKS